MTSRRALVTLFLAPSLAGSILFFGAPFIDVVCRSFANDAGTAFAGIENYQSVLSNEAFHLAVFNTVAFVVFCIPALLTLSLACALLLNKSTALRSFVKSLLLLPLALPVFAIALLVAYVFGQHGYLNDALETLGIAPIDWLGSDVAFWVLVAEYLWKNLGYATVLWLAALAAIPRRLGEAAQLDGASRWQQLKSITLPLLSPTAPIVVLLSVINAFKIYREAYLVAGSYPPQSMYLIPHLFNNWFANLSMGKLAAASVLLFAALSVLVALLVISWKKQERLL